MDNSSHSQPNHNLEVVDNTENTGYRKSIGIDLDKVVIDNLINEGLSESEIADSLATLLPLYQAEGLTPTSQLLADSILQMHRDAR